MLPAPRPNNYHRVFVGRDRLGKRNGTDVRPPAGPILILARSIYKQWQRPFGISSKTTVVLTGATGYLGRGTLSALIANPDARRTHCLAVRDGRRLQGLSNKVEVHEDDLVLPQLGLSDAEARSVFDAADVIIHNGADVSHLKSSASLRRPNVQATKDLAALGPGRVPLHYFSSGGACSFAAATARSHVGPALVPRFATLNGAAGTRLRQQQVGKRGAPGEAQGQVPRLARVGAPAFEHFACRRPAARPGAQRAAVCTRAARCACPGQQDARLVGLGHARHGGARRHGRSEGDGMAQRVGRKRRAVCASSWRRRVAHERPAGVDYRRDTWELKKRHARPNSN
ncbi:male sterility protein-domain-containing protein [Lasiosphaeria miniovina]|uniref:Male sterility protein-domain-containing protein n=1 Tax=Lasiosphaeria miniovina TaxID=1954250 RepID=A0AA40DLP5_9PEZI|nr:male sterility protein-domain-containing protein [Lasiosphaeria miniovina]KAK0705861.1 male sterility protein-domain-containing protein [Lasiosphaeria miniovina]